MIYNNELNEDVGKISYLFMKINADKKSSHWICVENLILSHRQGSIRANDLPTKPYYYKFNIHGIYLNFLTGWRRSTQRGMTEDFE